MPEVRGSDAPARGRLRRAHGTEDPHAPRLAVPCTSPRTCAIARPARPARRGCPPRGNRSALGVRLIQSNRPLSLRPRRDTRAPDQEIALRAPNRRSQQLTKWPLSDCNRLPLSRDQHCGTQFILPSRFAHPSFALGTRRLVPYLASFRDVRGSDAKNDLVGRRLLGTDGVRRKRQFRERRIAGRRRLDAERRIAAGGIVTGMVKSLFKNADRWNKRPCSELEDSAEVRQSLIMPELC